MPPLRLSVQELGFAEGKCQQQPRVLFALQVKLHTCPCLVCLYNSSLETSQGKIVSHELLFLRCTHVCILYRNIYACTHTCMDTHARTDAHACTHIHMRTRTHAHSSSYRPAFLSCPLRSLRFCLNNALPSLKGASR